MRIGVLGTGAVGNALATRLVGLGHDVVMGSRTAGNAKARAWAAEAGDSAGAGRAGEGTFADAAAHAELVINATAGGASLDALRSAGAANLSGKTVLDLSNALDSSAGFPPILSVVNDDSVGERIQREFPEARVVKALNTMNCMIMVDPGRLAGAHDVFLAGDDARAKQEVAGLLGTFGWPADAIRDLGGIRAARGVEMYLPLWLSLMQSLGTAEFNIRVVR